MSKGKKVPPCFIKISGNASKTIFNTENLFNITSESKKSPIDTYVGRNRSLLIKLGEFERADLLNINNEEDRHIYNLFLLGFVSNVESYFRSIIREIINIDPLAYKACLEEQVTYAAAIHHNNKLLPEALLEHCSFISKENISNSIKNFTGLSLNKQDINTTEVYSNLDLFEQLCQLRHCIVHRAGLLGSKNAIKLGIDSHKTFFEKPITLNTPFLQESNLICLNSVRTSNNLLFNMLIRRYIKEFTDNVTWNYIKDGKWFKPYFNLFYSNILSTDLAQSGGTKISCFDAYKQFRDEIMN
jgi:hypothetical protein